MLKRRVVEAYGRVWRWGVWGVCGVWGVGVRRREALERI
jgi:hypothetical protein